MFNTSFITDAIGRSAETKVDRRNMLIATGLAGLGAGAAVMAPTAANAATAAAAPLSDVSILNFALNLEYLEAEFYLKALGGRLDTADTTGTGRRGSVTGGHAVPFQDKNIKAYAREIANDERAHVKFLRAALGSAAVSRPAINLTDSFNAAAMAAGLIKPGQTFDPFLNENNFLIGAFIFEDVGVTAYKGASPFITNKTFLEAAAGLLAVEAYHAGLVRASMFARGLEAPAVAISNARDSLDGPSQLDQGLTRDGNMGNIVPTDRNALAYSRTPGQVLNIVYLNPKQVSSGGFFPNGANGDITTSDANG